MRLVHRSLRELYPVKVLNALFSTDPYLYWRRVIVYKMAEMLSKMGGVSKVG